MAILSRQAASNLPTRVYTQQVKISLTTENLLAPKYRGALFVMIASIAIAPAMIYLAGGFILDGRYAVACATLALAAFLVIANTKKLRRIENQALPRIIIGAAIAVTIFVIFELQSFHVFFWFLLFPMASMFLMGWREGLAWSAAILALSIALLPQAMIVTPGAQEDFFIIYGIVVVFSWAFEWLRDNAQSIAEQRLKDLRSSEDARQSDADALAQANKMKAIGQLTSGVAHDFNNLLTVVRGNIELAALDMDAELRNKMQNALSAVDSASELIDKLLTFSRSKALQPVPVDANEIVRSTVQLLTQSLGEQIALTSELADDLWLCEADPSELVNCLINLAINARDAMPAGGNLTITSRNQFFSADEQDTSEYVCIAVSDTGVGIPRHIQDHIFEPFFSTKDVGAGTGLGLSTVHGFVGQSGGHVLLDSTAGEGTCVSILLPRSHRKVPPTQAQGKVAPLSNNLRVLVLEDDSSVLMTIERMLKNLGCKVTSVKNTVDAHQHLLKDSFDILLTDIVLAEQKSGVDFAREARLALPELPVLFVSGYSAEMASQQNLPQGTELLAKPFSFGDLHAAMSSVLTKKARTKAG